MKDYEKNWNTREIIEETMKSYHSEPSPETKERLVALEVNQKNFMDKLEQFQSDNKEAHNILKEGLQSIEQKLDSALLKKANKWVETSMIWAFSSVGVVLIGLLIRWVVLLELK